MPSPHIVVRNTARLTIGALVIMLIAAIVFDTGHAPIQYVIRAMGPALALVALPLLFISIAAAREPSRSAFSLGVAFPLVVLGSLGRGLWVKFHSGTEGAMDVMFSFLFFWSSAAWTVLLFVLTPFLLRLLIVSWRSYRTVYGWGPLPILAWGALLLVAVNIGRAPVRAMAAETPEYHSALVSNAIEPLSECIWRTAGPGAEAGFPDSLSDTRSVQLRVYPRGANPAQYECRKQLERLPEYPFDVEYVARGRDASGRARKFTLTLTEKTRAGGRPRVDWIDETGLRRSAVIERNGQRDSVRLEDTEPLHTFLVVQHLIDEHAAKHGGEYPARIAEVYRYRDGVLPPPDVLAMEVHECDEKHEVISCVEMWDRTLVYFPRKDDSGRVTSYTLTMHPVTYWDYERYQPIPSRTHHRDAQGVVHSFGGYRAAEETDPPPAADELSRARTWLASYLEDRRRSVKSDSLLRSRTLEGALRINAPGR